MHLHAGGSKSTASINQRSDALGFESFYNFWLSLYHQFPLNRKFCRTFSVNMFGCLFIAASLLSLLTWFVGYHLYDYLRDKNGLRRFPALTPLAAFTNLPFMIVSHSGFRSKKLQQLHSQGKPVIRTGPNSLSYSNPRAIKDIYGHNSRCTKDTQYEMLSGSHYHLADVLDKHEHARKRKVLSSAYALKNLEEWEFKVADTTARMIGQFDERCNGEIVDYRSWTNFFALDAISFIGLSQRLGFLDAGNDRCWSARSDGSVFQVNYRECLYATSRAQSGLAWSYRWYKHLVTLSKIVSPWYRKLWKLNEHWDGIYLHLASERLKRFNDEEKLDDFFEALMHDKTGTPHNLEWGEILAEISIMMNAGSTTTAIAMANVMFQLLKNPSCMQRLREEIDGVLDEDDVVAPYEKVKYLPYLRACLDESLRLFPPTSHGLPRTVPPEGSMILGEFLPGGVTVSMSAYVVHRDPVIFPQPEKYNPDRWLGEKGKELGPYFVAFSAGARGCIGRNISYLEQTVGLATMIHRYDIKLADPDFEPTRRETFNLHLDQVPVRLRRRDHLV